MREGRKGGWGAMEARSDSIPGPDTISGPGTGSVVCSGRRFRGQREGVMGVGIEIVQKTVTVRRHGMH